MNRNLLDYEPDIMRQVKEIKHITTTEQPEIENLWVCAEEVLKNQFLLDAGDTGISRWEKMLGITPMGTSTLEERRFAIMARTNQQLPHTITTLKQKLAGLCGEDNYTVILDNRLYYLEVQVSLAAKSNFEAVAEMLEQMIPANLIINLTLKYRTHEPLTKFIHKQLKRYTHDQLRNEVIK